MRSPASATLRDRCRAVTPTGNEEQLAPCPRLSPPGAGSHQNLAEGTITPALRNGEGKQLRKPHQPNAHIYENIATNEALKHS